MSITGGALGKGLFHENVQHRTTYRCLWHATGTQVAADHSVAEPAYALEAHVLHEGGIVLEVHKIARQLVLFCSLGLLLGRPQVLQEVEERVVRLQDVAAQLLCVGDDSGVGDISA